MLNDWILSYTYQDKRATVLSIVGLVGRLFFALSAPLIGFIGKYSSMSNNLLAQSGLLVVIFGGLWITLRQIPSKYFAVKPERARPLD